MRTRHRGKQRVVLRPLTYDPEVRSPFEPSARTIVLDQETSQSYFGWPADCLVGEPIEFPKYAWMRESRS
jgi:hypothetical protein